MGASWVSIACIILILIVGLIWAYRVLNWLWLKPKRLERLLRNQGLQGNPYKFFYGDLKEITKLEKEARSKPMNLNHHILSYVFPYLHQTVNKLGKICFIWLGPLPRVILTDRELIKEVLNKINDFPKSPRKPYAKLLVSGLISYEGEKWIKHRKIINPAFTLEKLKSMLPIFVTSCNDLIISKWEGMLSSDGSCEIDVWPSIQNMTCDVISRAAFGSSYEEGERIFQLLKEQLKLSVKATKKVYIPGWRFLPTFTNRRMKEIDRDIKALLKVIIDKKEKALKTGEAIKNNLLSILLESNTKEIQEHDNNKNVGMSFEDVVEECKLFYFAGQETTAVLLVWTMVLLSRYPDWQERGRKEVFQVFGNLIPNFDQVNHLKIVTMILHEVLRFYPPAEGLARTVQKDVKLGNMTLPAGVQVYLPIILVHSDHALWGNDANEFNPERFSEGVLKATNGVVSFFPFGWGPRICVGQNFTMLEA
ncbi:11-oxo-beta-amyrin 30-oxidase, partial [Mucuna pruriens]